MGIQNLKKSQNKSISHSFSFLPERIHAKDEAFAHAKPVDCMMLADRVCKTFLTQ